MTITNTSSAPAFPQAVAEILGRAAASHEFGDGAGGMTLRQYFAAHAPHAIPPWFQPLMPAKPTEPTNDVLATSPEPVRKLATDWRRDSTFDLADYTSDDPHLNALLGTARAPLAAYEASWRRYRTEVQAWGREQAQQRVAQWPWAYANLVLNAETPRP